MKINVIGENKPLIPLVAFFVFMYWWSAISFKVNIPERMNRFCWPSLILIVFSLALDFGPVVAQNVTNLTDTNSTSFSKTKNRTKIDLVSCEWNEVRPKYSIVPAIVSSFLIIDGGILSTVGECCLTLTRFVTLYLLGNITEIIERPGWFSSFHNLICFQGYNYEKYHVTL